MFRSESNKLRFLEAVASSGQDVPEGGYKMVNFLLKTTDTLQLAHTKVPATSYMMAKRLPATLRNAHTGEVAVASILLACRYLGEEHSLGAIAEAATRAAGQKTELAKVSKYYDQLLGMYMVPSHQ